MPTWEELLPPEAFLSDALPSPESMAEHAALAAKGQDTVFIGQQLKTDMTHALVQGMLARIDGGYGKGVNAQQKCLAHHVDAMQKAYDISNPHSLLHFLTELSTTTANQIGDHEQYNLGTLFQAYNRHRNQR